MGNPNPNNPKPKPQGDKQQSGSDPLGKHLNPEQQGQGRDPLKDPNRQSGEQGDQRKQSGKTTRKPT